MYGILYNARTNAENDSSYGSRFGIKNIVFSDDAITELATVGTFLIFVFQPLTPPFAHININVQGVHIFYRGTNMKHRNYTTMSIKWKYRAMIDPIAKKLRRKPVNAVEFMIEDWYRRFVEDEVSEDDASQLRLLDTNEGDE